MFKPKIGETFFTCSPTGTRYCYSAHICKEIWEHRDYSGFLYGYRYSLVTEEGRVFLWKDAFDTEKKAIYSRYASSEGKLKETYLRMLLTEF